jgi:flagellin-specific chaperone FliS
MEVVNELSSKSPLSNTFFIYALLSQDEEMARKAIELLNSLSPNPIAYELTYRVIISMGLFHCLSLEHQNESYRSLETFRGYSYTLLSKIVSSKNVRQVNFIRKHFQVPSQSLLTYRQVTDLENRIHQRAEEEGRLIGNHEESPIVQFQKIKTLILENHQEELNIMIVLRVLKKGGLQNAQ